MFCWALGSDYSFTHPGLYTAMHSFLRLCELAQCEINEVAIIMFCSVRVGEGGAWPRMREH